MTFRPRMFAAVKGFTPLAECSSFSTNGMAVDYWHVSNNKNAGGHYVSMYPRVVIMLDGKTIPLSAERNGTVQSYVACYVPAGTELWSRFEAAGHLRHVDIHLSQERFADLAGHDDTARQPLFLQDVSPFRPLIELLADAGKSDAHREKLAECVFLELLHSGRTAAQIDPDQALLERLETYVHQNLSRRIEVDELADVCGASRGQLNRVMQRLTGTSTYRWVMQTRVKHAQSLLEKGLGFAEAAGQAGFADQAHFNRVFKSITGQVPSLWMIEPRQGRIRPNIQYKLG